VADLTRLGWLRNVVDPHAGHEVDATLSYLLRGPALHGLRVIRLPTAVQTKQVGSVDDQQEIVVDLEVDVQRPRRRRHERGRSRLAWVGHVDNAEAAEATLADVGVLVVDHDLDAMRTSALVGIAQQAQTRGSDCHTSMIAE